MSAGMDGGGCSRRMDRLLTRKRALASPVSMVVPKPATWGTPYATLSPNRRCKQRR